MSARIKLIQSIAAPINEARDLVDLHHAEVIAGRDAQIIAWLEKKAREEGTSNKDSRLRATAIYRMADKLSRGAVRPPLSGAPIPPQENYPGELDMLRGLLGVLRPVAQHGDMAEVQRLLAEHAADEQASYAEEKDTAPAATSTPGRPEWRPVFSTNGTDEPTGLAPVCTDPDHGDDDTAEAYACCPDPVIECESHEIAAYLVELLNADRGVA